MNFSQIVPSKASAPFVAVVAWNHVHEEFVSAISKGKSCSSFDHRTGTLITKETTKNKSNMSNNNEEEFQHSKRFPGVQYDAVQQNKSNQQQPQRQKDDKTNDCTGIFASNFWKEKTTTTTTRNQNDEDDDDLLCVTQTLFSSKNREASEKSNNNNNNNGYSFNNLLINSANSTSYSRSVQAADDIRDQQILLVSDIILVFVNSHNNSYKRCELFLKNRLVPLLVVGSSRCGVGVEEEQEQESVEHEEHEESATAATATTTKRSKRTLHCVLIDENTENDYENFNVFDNFCQKINSQQKTPTICFSAIKMKDIADPHYGGSMLEKVFEECVFKSHERILKDFFEKNKKQEQEQGEKQQEKKTNSNNNNKNNNLHTYSVVSIPRKQQQKKQQQQSETTEEEEQKNQFIQFYIICHDIGTKNLFLKRNFIQLAQNQNSSSDSEQQQQQKPILVTSAKHPNTAVSLLYDAEEVFCSNNNNSNDNNNFLLITIKPRQPSFVAAAGEAFNFDSPVVSRHQEARWNGFFSVGAVWGVVSSDVTQQKTKSTTSSSTTSTSTTENLLSPFQFHSSFPSCPQLFIVRVPKLHAKYCRGVRGTINFVGFGGEVTADIVAIASIEQRRLMEIASSAIGEDIYYACSLPFHSPLFSFSTQLDHQHQSNNTNHSRVLMSTSGGLRGGGLDEINVASASKMKPSPFCCPCEVLFSWNRFAFLQKMMKNIFSSQNNNNNVFENRNNSDDFSGDEQESETTATTTSTSQKKSSSSLSSFSPLIQSFLECESHYQMTNLICDNIIAPSCNNFMSTYSESFSLPISVSEEATDLDAVVKYLFTMQHFPSSSPENLFLSKSCVNCLACDLFSDISSLLVDYDEFGKNPSFSSSSTSSSTTTTATESLMKNYLHVRHINRHQQHSLRGSVSLCHFLLFFDFRIRELWSRQESQENNTINIKREQFGEDHSSFLKRFLKRFSLLPYLVDLGKKNEYEPLQNSNNYKNFGMFCVAATNEVATRNILSDRILVGQFCKDPRLAISSWEASILCSCVFKRQVEQAVFFIISKTISNPSNIVSGKNYHSTATANSNNNNESQQQQQSKSFSSEEKRIMQLLPELFLHNGNDGASLLYLDAAIESAEENEKLLTQLRTNSASARGSSYQSQVDQLLVLFRPKHFLALLFQSSSMPMFLETLRTKFTANASRAAEKRISLSSLLKTPVQEISSASPVLTLIANSVHGTHLKSSSSSSSTTATNSANQIVNFAVGNSNCQLKSLGDVMMFLIISDERIVLSKLPLSLLWLIATSARSW